MSNTIFRIITAFIMIVSIIWGYWWLTWALAIIFLFIIPSYYEILIWGVVYDALYGLPIPQFYNFPYVFTVTGIVFFLISIFLRKMLLAYESTI